MLLAVGKALKRNPSLYAKGNPTKTYESAVAEVEEQNKYEIQMLMLDK